MKKRVLKLYTLNALAKELGVSYGYLRSLVGKHTESQVANFRGFNLIGGGRRGWYAYSEKETIEIQIIDAEEEKD